MNTSITALYCCIDDFAKVFEDCERKQLISTGRKRMRSGKLSLSEMLFIMVLFHVSPFKNFKTFWHFGINQKYRDCFNDLPSYGRFVTLMPGCWCHYAYCFSAFAVKKPVSISWIPQSSLSATTSGSNETSFQGSGQAWPQHHGLVFRLQTTHGHQQQRRSHGGQNHSGQYG